MRQTETCLSLVILTEDSGKDGRGTIEALVRKMLGLVVPGCRLHDRAAFLPAVAEEEEAMRGNVWKTDGKNPREHDKRVRLLRYIARHLSQKDTFVVFHIDGDRPWSRRAESENVAKFELRVRSLLPQVAANGRTSTQKARRAAGVETPPQPALHLEHLLLLCPFRSIEAWLYQNVRRAIEICQREHRGQHVEALAAWETKREELDELEHPDREVCLGKSYNLALAFPGFPVQDVYDVGKSFTDSVEHMKKCTALRAALASTSVAD